MSVDSASDNPYTTAAPAVSELDQRRSELTARLRQARAVLSPEAAVAATVSAGDMDEAAALTSSIIASRQSQVHSGFQPRSMTMKLILERPDVTLRIVLAIVTLLFGARLATQFGSAAALIRTLKQTLDSVTAPPQA